MSMTSWCNKIFLPIWLAPVVVIGLGIILVFYHINGIRGTGYYLGNKLLKDAFAARKNNQLVIDKFVNRRQLTIGGGAADVSQRQQRTPLSPRNSRSGSGAAGEAADRHRRDRQNHHDPRFDRLNGAEQRSRQQQSTTIAAAHVFYANNPPSSSSFSEGGTVRKTTSSSTNASLSVTSSFATGTNTSSSLPSEPPGGPPDSHCLITQVGTDGFGHQYEGKLSCILLGMVLPENFTYVHTPFRKFEHIDMKASQLNAFTNLGAGNYSPSSIASIPAGGVSGVRSAGDSSQGGGRQIGGAIGAIIRRRGGGNSKPTERYWGASLNRLMDRIQHSGTAEVCSKGSGSGPASTTMLVVDNCWNIVYTKPVVVQLSNPSIRNRLRNIYLGSSKPDTEFNATSTRPNVVVHVRRGDAGDRAQDEYYYKTALDYYRKIFRPLKPVFWLETDDLTWEPITRWYKESPNDFRLPNSNNNKDTNILTTFHRMVMADGLVMSISSLSHSAALLSNATVKLVVPGSSISQGAIHSDWYKSSRFHVIYPPPPKTIKPSSGGAAAPAATNTATKA